MRVSGNWETVIYRTASVIAKVARAQNPVGFRRRAQMVVGIIPMKQQLGDVVGFRRQNARVTLQNPTQ
jgi:hypothetical protein